MRRDGQAVQDLTSCFPFDLAPPVLRPLQLAIPATLELILDFKKAKQDGETQPIKILWMSASILKKNPSMIA